ncbi:hypothetical protein BDP27DRAFT_1359191 [Rhodocollybia butyracea]|uniref:Methyltransferase domain-containing protein n=1 Tax=Rhodocollybia butyracea TaxID=206335 RepID=A0A9P5PYM2_9AGAR|nr:hypothetical protein BDP27DRAFT_1359191 [Rhodocollybia butyracea]
MASSAMPINTSPDDFLAPLSPPNRLAPRSRSPSKSHYRPFSTLLSPPDSLDVSPSKSRRSSSRPNSTRPLSSAMGFLKVGMGKDKGKEKEDKPVAPQREGFFNRTLKPKKSLNSLVVLQEEGSSTPPSLYTPSLASSFAESSTAGFSTSTPTPSSSSTFLPSSSTTPGIEIGEYDFREDKYEAKENWITRKHRLKLHPYGDAAPYMQSYDAVALSIDRYMHKLLRRINSNNTPSFHDYSKHQETLPASILDLGCGEGHWIIDSANSWPDARFVGFDLVDVTLPDMHNNERIKFIRGNFVRYSLPFPPNSFDLVRVCNLSLAIPLDRWNFVLSEVHRVLQVGGRLELIDDSVCFPYGKEISTVPRPKSFSEGPNRRKHTSKQRLTTIGLFEDEDPILIASNDGADEPAGVDITSDNEQEQQSSVQNGKMSDSDSEILEDEEASEETGSVGGDEEASECPSSPETSGEADGLFLDHESSRSSASSLQEPECHFDADAKPSDILRPPSVCTSRPIRPLPPPRRPLPPLPNSMQTLFTQPVEERDEDDLVTPTRLAITLPSPALALSLAESATSSSHLAESESESESSIIHLSPDNESSNTPSPVVTTPESILPLYKEPEEAADLEWSTLAKDGKALEAIFYDMLESKYGIHTRTPKSTAFLLKGAFGNENVRKVQTMHIKLAPPELEEFIPLEKRPMFRVRTLSKATEMGTVFDDDEEFGVVKRESSKDKKKSKKELSLPLPSLKESAPRSRASTVEPLEPVRSSTESAVSPNTLSAKAAVRLGITYTALAAATKSATTPSPSDSPVASVHSNRSSSSVVDRRSDESRRDSSETQTTIDFAEVPTPTQQSPGLLLLPSTFIPMPPAELEMHACKHMHTLLSCKRAISDWLLYNDDGSESDCISEEALRDAFFDYDSFRRPRLNWPAQMSDMNLSEYNYKKNVEIPFDGPKFASSPKSTSSIDSRLSSHSEASIGPYNRHELTHVRTIRVYLATKTRKVKSG